MSFGDFLVQQLGLDPSYTAARAKVAALPQVQSIFAGLPEQLGDAQTADQNFNAVAPNNQSGPGAYSTSYRSALSQLAAADPQDYAKEALTANDPQTLLDNTVKQATAENVRAQTQDQLAIAQQHEIIEDKRGNSYILRPGQSPQPLFQNPLGFTPRSPEGAQAADMVMLSHSPVVQSALGVGQGAKPTQNGLMTPSTSSTAPMASTGNPVMDALKFSLLSPTQKQAELAKQKEQTEAVQAAQNTQQSGAAFNANLDRLYGVADQVPYGHGFEKWQELQSHEAMADPNSPEAQALEVWNKGNNQNFLNSVKGLSQRTDLPLVNGLKAAGAVAVTDSPEAKKAGLDFLRANNNNQTVLANNKAALSQGQAVSQVPPVPYNNVLAQAKKLNIPNAQLLDRLRDRGILVQ